MKINIPQLVSAHAGETIVDKYDTWLEMGWEKLVDDFSKENFRPQNESDIKCHLYHNLLQTKSQISGLTPSHLVLSEFEVPTSQERIDLAVVRWRKRESTVHPRLLVEIKETSLAHLTADAVEERTKSDIDKLRRYKLTLEKKKKTRVLRYFKAPVIAFFFRGASKHGIGVKTEGEMKKLQQNYNDITFLWGPR